MHVLVYGVMHEHLMHAKSRMFQNAFKTKWAWKPE
jgi:hypothetical protein